MNCSQPWQPEAPPLQPLEPEKVFEFTCSEKLSALPLASVTLVTPVTYGNEPSAHEIVPETCDDRSVPLPTVFGAANGFVARPNALFGGVVHGISSQLLPGCVARKQPALGNGALDIFLRHCSRST